MEGKKLLEGKKYLTVSLLMPYIRDLRGGLNHALNYLKLPTPPGGDCGEERGDSIRGSTCRGLDICWGGGQSVRVYREGKRRHPQGIRQ